MDDFYSPLRYPGGKSKVSSYFKSIFKINSLYDGVYIEPYAGGSSVALSLLFNEYASKIIINDIDRSIYAFWYSVLYRTENLCRLIWDTPLNIEIWKMQRSVQKKKNIYSLLKLGFSTFYLNRTNRSGIIGAGVIGGIKQNGTWKLNARFNKEVLIQRIERIALYKEKIELHNVDAITLINQLNSLPQKSLFYFDPPYYNKGKDLYLNFYNHNDHEMVSKKITRLKTQKWIVSYDNVDQIQKFYDGYKHLSYSLNYSACEKYKGRELMIFSHNLRAPRMFPNRGLS